MRSIETISTIKPKPHIFNSSKFKPIPGLAGIIGVALCQRKGKKMGGQKDETTANLILLRNANRAFAPVLWISAWILLETATSPLEAIFDFSDVSR
jgi:hypothetical protein